ncbi:hypothetical protein PR048_000733 [Dryococelus australis]|uniref:Uncharacterized protein n=1 Tax=Dryococelus australis TaxID=614101 RepID=A0ABQ9IGC2_9NEOP|nr:hypothetical protein PR048_000733 [Dryococelus australis]
MPIPTSTKKRDDVGNRDFGDESRRSRADVAKLRVARSNMKTPSQADSNQWQYTNCCWVLVILNAEEKFLYTLQCSFPKLEVIGNTETFRILYLPSPSSVCHHRDYSPLTKANRVRLPAELRYRIFARGNRAGRCCLLVDFHRDLQSPPPPFHSGAVPYSLRSILIGSQDLDVKSRPNTFTHLLTCGICGGQREEVNGRPREVLDQPRPIAVISDSADDLTSLTCSRGLERPELFTNIGRCSRFVERRWRGAWINDTPNGGALSDSNHSCLRTRDSHSYTGSPNNCSEYPLFPLVHRSNSRLARKHLANPITARCEATANEHAAEAPVCRGVMSLAYRAPSISRIRSVAKYVRHLSFPPATVIGRQLFRHVVYNWEPEKNVSSLGAGTAVTERLVYSLPAKANQVQSPDFRKWESCRTMALVGVEDATSAILSFALFWASCVQEQLRKYRYVAPVSRGRIGNEIRYCQRPPTID